jgi:hypothetical protein
MFTDDPKSFGEREDYMPNDGKPKGRAVVEKATIKLLDQPDGSKRMVSSRPVGDPENILNWIVLLWEENPDNWYDLKDLYRFVSSGEPLNGRLDRRSRKTMRGFLRQTKTLALKKNLVIVTRTDSKGGGGGVTHFKLLNKDNLKETRIAIHGATKDRVMQVAFSGRVTSQCGVLNTDTNVLDGNIEAMRRNKERNTDAAQQ